MWFWLVTIKCWWKAGDIMTLQSNHKENELIKDKSSLPYSSVYLANIILRYWQCWIGSLGTWDIALAIKYVGMCRPMVFSSNPLYFRALFILLIYRKTSILLGPIA